MENSKSEKRPDLVEVLDALRQENEKLSTHAERVFFFANQFKDIRQPSAEEIQKEQEPKGIVEQFKMEIRKTKKANDILRQTNEGLQSIIGN